jgi:hypothetical protein
MIMIFFVFKFRFLKNNLYVVKQEYKKSTIVKNQNLEVSSKYEDRWKRMGKDIWDLTIYADKLSPDMKPNKDFSFGIKNNLLFSELVANLPKKPIVKDDFVVHFSYSFEITNKSWPFFMASPSATLIWSK